jgi:hypothetical protein
MRTAIASYGNLAAVGSKSGHVILFDVNKGITERVLMEEQDAKPVVNCAW